MKKIIILLLCWGVFVSIVGCGGNTAPPPTESLPTMVSETVITEAPTRTNPPVTTVEPTEEEKEPVPSENKYQATEPTVTAPTATAEPTQEPKPTETVKITITNTAKAKVDPQITKTVPSTTPQLEEKETAEIEPPKKEPKAETEPPKVTKLESTEKTDPFDIDHWITFTKEYAVSIGLILDNIAMDCWDNPIRAGALFIYLERDIQSRLNRYAKDEDITDVWIWAEATGNDCYDLYIGYA